MFKKSLFGLDKNGGYKVWTIRVPELEPVQIIITHGKEGGAMQEKVTNVPVGKQGRTPFEQGVSEAEGKIKKQMDKGYRESKEELVELPLLAMLAHDYHKQGHRIKFPCYVSDKFDGVRCLAKCVADTTPLGKKVILESRTGQPYDVPHISAMLCGYMGIGDVLDGEIYLHGYELQDITSAVKRTDTQAEIDKACRKLTKAEASGDPGALKEAQVGLDEAVLIHNLRPRLEFHAFDVPGDFAFKDRYYVLLGEYGWALDEESFLKIAIHKIVNNEQEMIEAHADSVRRGYEGLMLRNFDGLYESGKRSADLQKYKTFLDSEFKILDVIPDKQDGCRFVVQNDVADNTFTVVMGDHAQRVYYLAHKHLFIGKHLKVKYQSRYKGTLIPQFPVGICFRSCDANGNPVE